MKVLFLSHWYPNRNDAMDGLFVQKHAEAVSLYNEIIVLHIHPEKKNNAFEITKSNIGKITEYAVYYPGKSDNIYQKINKTINYFRAYLKGFKIMKSDGVSFDIIHSNILTRTGFISYLLYITKNRPYVITEHWSRYLPEREDFKGIIRIWLTKIIIKNAKAVLPVSNSLKTNMERFGLQNNNYLILNNVVNDFFYNTGKAAKKLNNKKNILHVSCFDDKSKNISGILRAVQKLSLKRQDFTLFIVGSGIDYKEIRKYSSNLGLNDNTVQYVGEKTPIEVSDYFRKCDFFVLFSNFENAPVVISESLASGKPVISTDVGGIKEHVNNSNGLLIKVGDEGALEESINYMLDNFQNYNAAELSASAYEKYSYEHVGKFLTNIYKAALNEI